MGPQRFRRGMVGSSAREAGSGREVTGNQQWGKSTNVAKPTRNHTAERAGPIKIPQDKIRGMGWTATVVGHSWVRGLGILDIFGCVSNEAIGNRIRGSSSWFGGRSRGTMQHFFRRIPWGGERGQ